MSPKVLWEGTSGFRDIMSRKMFRRPARVVESLGELSVEFADMPEYPDIFVAYTTQQLHKPDPPLSSELQKRLKGQSWRQ
jgi:hypothetical protein